MKHLKLSLLLTVFFIAMTLQSCNMISPASHLELSAPQPVLEQIQAPTQSSITEPQSTNLEEGGPAEVAMLFFDAYITAVENFQPTLGDPNFESEKYLSSEYLKQIAEIRAGFDGFGFDPILQTQDVPPKPMEVKEVSIEGNRATVILQFGRGLLEQPFERRVSLEQIDENWLIVPDWSGDAAYLPGDTVDAFYNWYLGYINAEGEPRNPLVDRAYRASPYLHPGLVSRVDQMIEESEWILYDPFLCAQDVPSEIKEVVSYNNNSRPLVLVETSFAGHYMVLELVRVNFNQWAIRDITCGLSPAGTAKAFYTWALAYMTDDSGMNNPWVDGAYRQSPFLSQSLIQELDEKYASSEPIIADPVFLAQDLPNTFTTAPCPDPDCALVNLQYGSSMVRQLRVEMVTEEGKLRIDSISHPVDLQPAEIDGWVSMIDEQYGYAVAYPAEWIVNGLNLADQHSPEESPRMRSIYFIPETDAKYSPLNLDVLIWNESDLSEAYALGQKLEEIQVNDYTAHVYRSDPGIIYYVFQHPSRPDVWIILGDYVTQFPGREEFARSVEGVFQKFVSTITFSQ